MKVVVRNNNVDRALKILKRHLQSEGFYKELRKRSFYEKPSDKRKRKLKEARKKMRKAMRAPQRRFMH